MSKNGNKKPRVFSIEFKRDAVNLVDVEGYSYSAAARAVGVSYSVFRKWYDKFGKKPEPCGEDATKEELQAEVKRLKKELYQAELEREILKKATAFFAKESQ